MLWIIKIVFTIVYKAVDPSIEIPLKVTETASRGVFERFAKFTGKRLCHSLFFIKVASDQLY